MEAIAASSTPFRVSFKFLLRLYLAIPLCLCAYAVDQIFLDGLFVKTFPDVPEGYFFIGLLFGLPHIVASNLILATNKEYMVFYKNHLLIVSAAIIFFLVV